MMHTSNHKNTIDQQPEVQKLDAVKVESSINNAMKALSTAAEKVQINAAELNDLTLDLLTQTQSMNNQEKMKFLEGQFNQFQNSMRIGSVTSSVRQDLSEHQLGLNNKQTYSLAMGVAILATISYLAYLNPGWALRIAIPLAAVLATVVITGNTEGKK